MRHLSALLVLALPLPLRAAPPDFDRTVAPVLTACLDCHTGKDAKGGLDLSRKASGVEAAAEIWKRVDANEMPPKKPLSAADKATLKGWIDGGAKWGTDPIDPLGHTTTTRAGRDWWSLQPVKKPAVPDLKSSNPIDAFILTRLAKEGLTPSPQADKRTLIRRLKFDLLGLPPTPEEVEAFVKDGAPDAYEKLVEAYLASPQFGERWARHWLDAVRFAESHGFETNTARPNAWPYRDWVIKSFNDDKPYDKFVFEQLSGDTTGADAATGFLVAGPWDAVKSPDVNLTRTQRADELHDIVSTTGSTFLGLTVGCARCHTHKFDPIPQLDYYRLTAVFAGVQHGERPLRTGTAVASSDELADPTATKPRRPAVSALGNVERFKPVTAKFVRFTVTATNGAEPCIDELEVFTSGTTPANVALASAGAKATSSGDYPGAPDIHRLEFINDGKYGNGRSWISNTAGRGQVTVELAKAFEIDRVVWARDREGKYADRLATKYRIEVSADGKAWQAVASSDDRAGAGRSDAAYVGRFSTPEPTALLYRGDPMERREPVGPGTLTGIGPALVVPEKATDAERRVALAKWITDPANPLTARVIVNRVWQHHFGTGLVATPSDFGFNGGRPSHPELLDWLANDLASGGRQPPVDPKQDKQGADAPRSPEAWSLKHLHRRIVLSNTYRQASVGVPTALAKDAQSRLLWRYPPRRLEAEAIRDAVLAVSGKLDLTPGGPGFDLFEPNGNYVKVYTPKKTFGPAEFRRMVYQTKHRMQLDDTFGAFDCPDGGQIAPKRNASTTPLQALNLLNSPFLLQQAGFLAERVSKDAGKEPPAQVRWAFLLAFQREPTEKEATAAAKLVTDHGLPALCRALLNANEFLYVD